MRCLQRHRCFLACSTNPEDSEIVNAKEESIVEYKTWSARWKQVAKYYRKELQIERGIRCEICEKNLNTSIEFGVCKKCAEVLVSAMNEPPTRILNSEASQ